MKLQNLQFGYRKHEVFSNLTINFEAGKIYGLLGKNGEGKSTMLYLMTGLLRAKSGSVTFKGKDMSQRLPSALEDMFLVPEEFELPQCSLKEFVKSNAGYYPNFSQEIFEKCLQGFELDINLNLKKLSMGTKKKVYVCFALATNTSLLLMDEPTNGLDIPSKSQFRQVIASCMTDDKTIIISTHQVRDVENLIDQIMVLNKKEIVFNHSTAEINQKLAFKNGQISKVAAESDETTIDIEALFTAIVNGDELVKTAF
ncbi:MAG: ATP-binding cassette domain-containing protein [Salinivirgaceae bacterium]|nr:ATP-binding cassette domain-containing protein [Salinivirgaceae bacterium]